MNTEPLALRLADRLSGHGSLTFVEMHAAAAELRRLYAELERCKQVCAATSESWRTDAEKWKGQRDALLEALKMMLEQFTKTPSTLKDSEARIKAHAAIKQAEKNT